MRAFLVDAFRVRLDDIARNIVGNIEQTLVVFDGIIVVYRCIVELILLCIVSLFELNDPLHERTVQIIL